MNKSDLGKYLRVTIEQTFEGHKQSPIISNVIEPLQNYFSQTALFYDDVVLVGNRPDETKIMAFALDAFEKAIFDITFSFPNEIEDLYYLQYSQDILVQLDKEGFKTGYNLVFVTVQQNLLLTEMPTLSTDRLHIPVGYAKWLENDDTLEYSLNGGISYQTVTTEPFETSAGTAIYVRKKSVGTPNKKGYIKESSARSISVTGSHIGRWTGEFSFEQPTLFSTAYILEADTNAIDGTEFTVTLKENNKSVTAKAYSGKLVFDVSGVFNKTVKGGKQYQMTVEVTDATLSSSAEFSVDYWPVVEAEWNCPTGMTVYNGRAKYLQFPVPEYNYEAESVEVVHTFQVIDKDGSTDITPAAAETWQLSNMKSYISNVDHDGQTVVMNVSMTPVRDGEAQNVLSCFDTIRYYIRKDVKVEEVIIYPNFGQYEAIMYAEENVSLEGISYTETAGGDIEYKWEIQTGPNVWEEVGQVSDKTYVIKQSDIGKPLRVTITQTFEGVKQSPLTSNVVTVKNLIKSSSLYYDGVVLVGESVALGNVLGTAVDVFGNEKEVDGMTFQRSLTEEEYKMPMLSSRIVPITLTAVDYEDGYSMVFVPVQAVMAESDLPPLRTDVQNIDVGYAAFELINYDLEYSINGGLTYADMTADTFPAKAGDEIYVRKKTLGIPNEMGYIKESQPLPLTVTEANVGVRTSGGGMIGSIAMSKLSLTKTGYGGMIFIVPHLEVATGLPQVTYNYQWLIDGIDISQYEGISTNNKHELVINKYQLGSDAYHIYCCVTAYASGEQIAGLSSQMTLVIE